MKFVIAHREVSGVYLCYQEGLNLYWGPRELAREYSAEAIAELTKVFPQWRLRFRWTRAPIRSLPRVAAGFEGFEEHRALW